MKLTITQSNLVTSLARASGTMPERSALPVLSNVLAEAEDDSLRVTSTDLDAWIRSEVPAEVREPGRTTLPGSVLLATARELSPSPVVFEVEDDRLEMTCDKSRFTLYGIPASEYPKPPQVDFDSAWSIERKALIDIIDRTTYAASTEDSRPILNGVLWELRDGTMKMVATDGHRLAAFGKETELGGELGVDLIVPPLALKNVRTLFQESGSAVVEVARSENYLGFRMERTEIYTRLIEGRYPNYRQVIPQSNEFDATMAKKGLTTAIARVLPFTDDTRRMRVSLSESRLVAEASAPDLGKGVDEQEVDYDGPETVIGFNADYLAEALARIPGEDVTLSFRNAESAVVLKPVETEGEEPSDIISLVMPLRLLD